MSDIVQRLNYWRGEMQRTIKALESNPKFADVVDGNRSIYTTLGMAKTEIEFSRTTIANLTEALRAAEEEKKALREAVCMAVAELMRASGRLEVIAGCNEDRRIAAALSGTVDYIRSTLAGANPC